MPPYKKEELYLRGINEAEEKYINSSILKYGESNNLKIESLLKEKQSDLRLAARLFILKCSGKDDVNDMPELLTNDFVDNYDYKKMYHDFCVKDFTLNLKFYGQESFQSNFERYNFNGECPFSEEDFRMFRNVPYQTGKRGELLKEMAKSSEELVFLQSNYREINKFKTEVNTLNSIKTKLIDPLDKQGALDRLTTKRKEYSKISHASRFFSYFLPNAWTKAGRKRNEINVCKSILSRNGLNKAEIDSGKLANKADEPVKEVAKDNSPQKKNLEIADAKENLNSKKEFVSEKQAPENTLEKSIEKK